METAMASAAAKAARTPSVSVQQMPLSFLKEGESAHVVKVRGRGDLQHHLENLGFVEGAEVKVVSRAGGHRPSSGVPYHHLCGNGVADLPAHGRTRPRRDSAAAVRAVALQPPSYEHGKSIRKRG